ncbi:MAG TPA: allantoinase AllB [Thermoanaerobaculia bacterium]|nr:allantoinase AllB [Thermoanaerobaculia bacterium]
MGPMESVIRSRRVVADGAVRPASIHIRNGAILQVADWDDVPDSILDYGDHAILPGLVDSHVHVNEPGRTEWEGFETATRAAAKGGITTLIDMPLNSSPPTTTLAGLELKVDAMTGKCRVDVGLWGGAVRENGAELIPLLDAGVLGFKCFLVDSGVAEFSHLDAEDLAAVLTSLMGRDVPLLVHAELPGAITQPAEGPAYEGYLRSRPGDAEDQAVALIERMVERFASPAHIVHLSSAGAIETIRRARERRLPLTAETTPHYLHLWSEAIPDGATEFKCAPPIRERENRERLWSGLADGVIECIVSDHSPCSPELKLRERGDFAAAWGGIASVQLALPVIWTESNHRGHGLEKIAEWMSAAPARLARIHDRKGAIAAGYDADLTIFDPAARFRVVPAMIEHRHKLTPYLGEELAGVVLETWLRGIKIYDNGEHIGPPLGQWIRRTAR